MFGPRAADGKSMERAAVSSLPDSPSPADGTSSRRRLLASFAFAAITVGALVLLGRRFTHTSWPLAQANLGLVGAAVAMYFASFVLRALGWQKLFPAAGRPDRARCLAACGASAASGVVLPFRLDYLVKIGTLRRMRGVKLGLEAIAFSIISLGLVDAIAFLPLSISATATSSSSFRVPLLLVVLFGVGACGLLVGGRHLLRVPFIARRERLAKLAARAANRPRGTARESVAAWFFLVGCWTSRALGSTPNVEVDLFSGLQLEVGDAVILVSDGVTGYLDEDDVAAVLLEAVTAQQAAERIVDQAVQRGGGDNATAVVVRRQ